MPMLLSVVAVVGWIALGEVSSGAGERRVTELVRVIRGSGLALAAAFATMFLLRQRLFAVPRIDDGESGAPTSRGERDAGWFVDLRWLAAAVTLGLITCARPEARGHLMVWWIGLVVANLVFLSTSKLWRHHETQIVIQASVDLVLLTGFLNASGGLENPLYMVFLAFVILGRVLVTPGRASVVTGLTMAAFAVLAFGEYLHVLPHHPNLFFPHVEAFEAAGADHGEHGHELVHAAYDLYFVLGRAIPFLLVLLLTDVFLFKVMHRIRRDREQLEEAARAARLERERLERVVDAAEVGLIEVDDEMGVLWFSEKIGLWFGWGTADLGRSCPQDSEPDARPACVAGRTLESGQTESMERAVATEHGERWFRHVAAPVRGDDGQVVGAVEVVEDMTARRALETEASRAAKLSALGRMASGIAHEVGNPLASLSTRLRLLERRETSPFVAESVEVLQRQVDRIARIVEGVSRYSKVGRREHTVWDLEDLVEETIQVARYDKRARGAELRAEIRSRGARIRGSRDQVGQILLNLVLNALDVTSQGGVVDVRLRLRAGQVEVRVEDEGPGIPPEDLEHVFDPFFTTKDGGSGLGLYLSSGFAAAHGGRIGVENLARGGARFTLVLPLARSPESAAGPKS